MDRFLTILLALLPLAPAPARAAVIYSGLQNFGIPTDSAGTGIYLDLDAVLTGTDDNSPPAGWDINPFYGGVGVANSPAFQPVRNGVGNMAPILGLTVGAKVDVTRLFSSGYGGSDSHLGTQFTAGQEGYLGFKFTTNAGTIPYYGWMRVVFTGNTAGAVIKDWAYENSGAAIVTARVAQSAAVASAQVVTLSPGSGESFTLGSALTNTGGNSNSLVKTSLGTAIVAGPTTNTGSTTVTGGTLIVKSVIGNGASAVSVTNSGSTLKFDGVSQTLGSLSIGAGATVTFSSGPQHFTKNDGGTQSLSGFLNFASVTTNAGVLNVNGAVGGGTSSVAVNNPGTKLKFGSVSQTLASLSIGAGANVIFTSGVASGSVSGEEDGKALAFAGNLVRGATAPEPGTLGLLLVGALGVLGRRRRGTASPRRW